MFIIFPTHHREVILKDMREASQLYKNLPIRFYTETNYY